MVRDPFIAVKTASVATGLTSQGARNLIRRAEGLGWLTSLGTHSHGGREHWVATELLRIMEAPMRYGE